MRALLALAFTFISTTAFAHTGVGETSGLLYGFAHPLGGIDHVLAMVAVGIFAYVLGGRALYLVPLSFVGMMVVGFLAGASGADVPFIEVGIALSSVVIGGAAALGRPMHVAGAMALVGIFAVFHGHAHGAEMPSGSSGLLYVLGFIAATTLLHAAGSLAAVGGAKAVGRFGRPLARLTGGALAILGLGVLGGWL